MCVARVCVVVVVKTERSKKKKRPSHEMNPSPTLRAFTPTYHLFLHAGGRFSLSCCHLSREARERREGKNGERQEKMERDRAAQLVSENGVGGCHRLVRKKTRIPPSPPPPGAHGRAEAWCLCSFIHSRLVLWFFPFFALTR